MIRIVGTAAVILMLAAGCSSNNGSKAPQPSSAPKTMAPYHADNGRLIYQTGRDGDGVQITAQKPPLRPSCAACHRADGSGGVHLPGGAVSADLRHKTLSSDTPPWTAALVERAISTGIDNKGKTLDPVMPRWKLSPRDLADVTRYVLTQLK